jgi:acyl carrier protein
MCNARIKERELHPDDNLFELGISSLTLAEIHADIESAWPETLDITDLFDYPTVSEITAVLEQRNAQKSGSAAQLVDA